MCRPAELLQVVRGARAEVLAVGGGRGRGECPPVGGAAAACAEKRLALRVWVLRFPRELAAAGVELPEALPSKGIKVTTRKKLAKRRTKS